MVLYMTSHYWGDRLIIEIVIDYKLDNYKIIGKKVEIYVIIIVIDENNYSCNCNWSFYQQIIVL